MLAAVALAAFPAPAFAGPPYDTDDPEPTDYRHWELYLFGAGARSGGAFDGSAGLDLNYGVVKDVQLTATLPADFTRGPVARTGVGDVELGVKYRFYRDDAAGFSIAAFPRLILPSSGQRYGSGKTALLLPVWAQKDIAKWSFFGGGGYAINPGTDNRNYWQVAGAVTREVSSKLSIGVEATHRGPDAAGARPTTTLGIGGIYRLKGPLSLLASAGPSFGGRDGDKYHAYVALGLSF
ncbi:MAG: transporter [Sphingomonas sp.]